MWQMDCHGVTHSGCNPGCNFDIPHLLPVWHPWPANIDIRHVNVDCLMCCVAMTEGELLTLHLIGLYNILSHHVVPSPSTRYMVCYWWFIQSRHRMPHLWPVWIRYTACNYRLQTNTPVWNKHPSKQHWQLSRLHLIRYILIFILLIHKRDNYYQVKTLSYNKKITLDINLIKSETISYKES